jgi:tetratricopeptide (TPR) repeat protein
VVEGRTFQTVMTPELWQRLKSLYHAALERPEAARAQFADEACGDDDELKKELIALLQDSKDPTDTDIPIVNFRDLFPAESRSFSDGQLILDRFRIVRHLGSGGMGEVYEAKDLALGRIALKTIRPNIAANTHMLSRFKREVQLALKISGPHVCRIHDFHPSDAAAGRSAFLTMEFLEGITLADKIRESGPLPWREVKTIALEICEGLRVMHEAGIIHRDLKSRNVMLANRNGATRAVVMDFGLAREVRSATSETVTDVSAENSVAGTIDYMAPEQFAGDPLTPAADIFALGVVMYELATGRHPFPSGTILQAAIRRGQRPPAPSSIQRGLPHRCDEIICRCLEFDPKKRYRSASEVTEALKSSPLSVSRLREEIAPVPKRRLAGIAALVCIVIAAAVGYIVYRSTRYVPPSTEAKRWYDRGLAALREGTYLQAVNAFKMAVQHDKKFLVAHARLAEAWQELDFTGPAQTEMLAASVPEQESVLPDLDRKYIEAVRTTLTQDFPGAVERYKDILNDLPGEQRAYGYVDLGRAYEKIGDLKDAVQSYEHAASLTPENPAPLVHLGILKSRQMDMNGGEAAFQKADSLYEAESNLEGRAEVAYQRGYAANVRGDSEKAKTYLNISLEIARQIPNVQLEVRTLGQLSDAEDGDKAVAYAKQEVQLAQENDIEYWATDGMNWLGTAYFLKEDFGDAEQSHLQALKQSKKNQHQLLAANAEFGLASIRDQQGKWDDSIPLAKQALQYYEQFTHTGMAAEATELIIRGERGKGHFDQALKSATDLVQIARKWEDTGSIEIGEESIGNISLDLENYPDSLSHFEEALKAGRSINQNVAYQQFHYADALWRLGRYNEAEDMLHSISADAAARSDIASAIAITRADMLLSQRHFREALSTSQQTLRKFPDLAPANLAELDGVEIVAETELGQIKQAQLEAQNLLGYARNQSDEELTATANMVQSIVALRSNLLDEARSAAERANQYFVSKGKKESEWLSLYCIALAYKASGDSKNSAINAGEALDILGSFEHTWGPPTYRQYLDRPDHQVAFHELTRLAKL